MSSGECLVCGVASTLVDGLCRECRLLQSAAKDTVKDESSMGDLRRPFLEAFESSAASPGDRGPVPVEVDTVRRARPESTSGKFTLVEKVGAGGVGDVWKAWDHPLHRWVALKFLKNEDEIDVQRFQREARTVGQLSHPHIAPVFEVGMLDGHHYIAMQFVEGATLQDFIKRDERLISELIRDTALALHYAHEKGIVHRDIKPSNLMVEAVGSQTGRDTPSRLTTTGYHVYVMDFGLAKQVEIDSSITRVNSVLGTPAYMSPEQVQGKNDTLDQRTDVYSLGVTLYEMFSGEVPFRASSTYDLFRMIDNDEPISPRQHHPKLDRDLETIVLKCMEKDPGRRYQTAQELADELTRWLDGDAILSHPPSTMYRVQKFVSKRKALVSLSLVGLFAVAGLSGFFLFERSKKQVAEKDRIKAEENRRIAEEEAEAARENRLDLLRKETRYRLDTLLRLRRSGSREGVEEDVKQIKKSCDDVLRDYPELAEPHYIKGRMFRAVLVENLALQEQKEAVRIDPGYAPARYELVVLEVQQYRLVLRESQERTRRRKVEQVLQGTSQRPRKANVDPDVEKELVVRRERLEVQLRELENLVREGEAELSEGKLACARGLWLWISGDLSGAKSSLEEAVEKDQFLEEGYEALATMEMDAACFEGAVKWWDRGVMVDKGYAPHFEGRGFARTSWGQSLEGKNSQLQYRAAILDFDNALSLRARTETWMMRGLAHLVLATATFELGKNPGNLFQKAVKDFDQAVEMEPGGIEPRTGRARATLVVAHFARRMRARISYDAIYRSAIRDLELALELDSSRAEVWSMSGAAKTDFGFYLEGTRENPIYFFEGARDDYRKACELSPGWGETWVRLGLVLTRWGVQLEIQEKDPLPIWKEGEEGLSKAIEIDETWAEAWLRRGAIRGHIGSYLRNFTKEDPEEVIRSAIRDLTKSLSLGGDPLLGRHYRGSAYFNLARLSHRGSAEHLDRETYRKARDDFRKALQLNPGLKRELEPLIKDCGKWMK